MRARDHAARGILRRQNGTQWETTANTLGRHHDIRSDTGPFMCKELSGPANTALNLVQHHQHTGLVAEIAQTFQAGIGQRTNTALALNRLHQYGCNLGILHDLAQGVMVTKRQLYESGQKRSKTLGHLLTT